MFSFISRIASHIARALRSRLVQSLAAAVLQWALVQFGEGRQPA